MKAFKTDQADLDKGVYAPPVSVVKPVVNRELRGACQNVDEYSSYSQILNRHGQLKQFKIHRQHSFSTKLVTGVRTEQSRILAQFMIGFIHQALFAIDRSQQPVEMRIGWREL